MRPITPQPGYTEQDLHDLLATKRFIYVDCYTMSNKDGRVLLYSSAQKDVDIKTPVAGGMGVVYSSKRVKVSGLKLETGVGVEIDEQSMHLDFGPDEMYVTMKFAAALRYGRFDGGSVRRDRYFAASWGNWVAGVPMFVGKVSSLDKLGRSFADLKVKSDLVLLSTPMPRKLFDPSCLHTLFDPGCGLNKADYVSAGTVGAGATAVVIPWSSSSSQFSYGTFEVDDQAGATLVRTIDLATDSELVLSYPLEFAPGEGTNFRAYPGCIRSYERCGEFNNTQHFQGFPFVPVSETAY